MAVEDGSSGGSLPSDFLSSLDPKLNEAILSPDDLAWVDSCLTKDPEVYESNWDSLKQALLEVLEFSATKSVIDNGANNEVDTVMIPAADESATVKFSAGAEDDKSIFPFDLDEAEIDFESSMLGESSQAQTFISPFLPNYKEFLDDEEEGEEKVVVSSEFELEELEIEPAGKEIFKVWELEMPEEEGDFAKELSKAMAATGKSLKKLSSSQPNVYSEDGSKGSLHDLVAGMADLSLDQDS